MFVKRKKTTIEEMNHAIFKSLKNLKAEKRKFNICSVTLGTVKVTFLACTNLNS